MRARTRPTSFKKHLSILLLTLSTAGCVGDVDGDGTCSIGDCTGKVVIAQQHVANVVR